MRHAFGHPRKYRLIASISYSHVLSLIVYFSIQPEVPLEAAFYNRKRRCAAHMGAWKKFHTLFCSASLSLQCVAALSSRPYLVA